MTEVRPFVFHWGDELGVRSWARAVGPDATVALHEGPDDRWQKLDAPERFADWARLVAERLPACRSWITVRGLNQWPVAAFGDVRRLATGRLLRAFDHQLAAHVLVRQSLEESAPDHVVEPGIERDDWAYEIGQLLVDALAAPAAGVARGDVGPYLRERKTAFDREHPTRSPRHRLSRQLIASAIPLEQALPRALGAIYGRVRV
jgi:hypothetical protein